MSVTKAFTLYAATINGTLIDQVRTFSLTPGLEPFVLAADGGVDPTFAAAGTVQPRVTFGTTAIATALGSIGISGLAISSSATFFFQKYASGGTRATGTSHVKMAATQGMVLPRTLTAATDTPAEISYETICLADGANAPVLITTGQALTGSPTVGELFVAGPVSINGTDLDAVRNINIDFGLQELVLGGDGETYPTFAAIQTRMPKITIDILDADYMATLGVAGLAQNITDSEVYLRKVAKGGTRVADATLEHVKFTVDDGRMTIFEGSADEAGEAVIQVEITPVFDGTNDIMAIDTAAAIS